MHHPVGGFGDGHQFQIGHMLRQAFAQAGQQGHVVLCPQHQRGHTDVQGFGRDLYRRCARFLLSGGAQG